MELSSPFVIKNLLKKHGLWAKKALGQHFLIDKNILKKIIEAANLKKGDVVLEIGPGIGILTKELAQRVKKVVAVEIDKKIVGILREMLKGIKNVEIIEGDILRIKNLRIKNYKIVANIPYQITSPLLEKFLTPNRYSPIPSLMVLMVQKEVAQKICSKPPRMNRLGIFVQLYGTPKIIVFVSKNCFWPRPEVDSAILRIEVAPKSYHLNPKTFLDLVKKGFSQKRKQLKNIFDKEILKNAGIMPTKRAEELTLDDWLRIYNKEKNG